MYLISERVVEALLYYSKQSEECVKEIVDMGFVPHLVRLLNNDDNIELLTNTVHILNKITNDDDTNVRVLLDANIFPLLIELMSHSNSDLAYFVLSLFKEIILSNSADSFIDVYLCKQLFSLLITNSKISTKKLCLGVVDCLVSGSRDRLPPIFKAGICLLLKELLLLYEEESFIESAAAIARKLLRRKNTHDHPDVLEHLLPTLIILLKRLVNRRWEKIEAQQRTLGISSYLNIF